MAVQQPRDMDETEIRLALHGKEEVNVPVAEIARRLGRTRSSIWKVVGDVPVMKVGVSGRGLRFRGGAAEVERTCSFAFLSCCFLLASGVPRDKKNVEKLPVPHSLRSMDYRCQCWFMAAGSRL